MPTCDTCQANWRIELCDLTTGTVKAVYPFLATDWQTVLNDAGRGTVVLATKQVAVADIWPHKTSVYILRTSGDGASVVEPAVEFAGYVEAAKPDDNGATQVGLISIEGYLKHRVITDDLTFTGVPQTQIAAELVNYAAPDGIPLIGVALNSTVERDRAYVGRDKKNVLEALTQLTDVIDGPDWFLTHEKMGGRWVTSMRFTDRISDSPPIVLKSDREANGYAIDIDAKDHATNVFGVGAGTDEEQLESVQSDESGFYPRFDATPAWSDETLQESLDEQTAGYLDDHKDVFAVPTVTVPGLVKVNPNLTRLGYTVGADICYGAVTFRGRARILSISWRVQDGGPEERTFDLLPEDSARVSVYAQEPCADDCPECGEGGT